MSESDDQRSYTRVETGGLIAWFARNAYAANLLMATLVLAGIASISVVKQEVLPTIEQDIVTITVEYFGASPQEIVEGVILPIESEVTGLEATKKVTANATEGVARVYVELQEGENRDLALQDIRNAVDSIETFPDEAEPPRTTLAEIRETVLRYAVKIDAPESELYLFATSLKDRLLALPEVSQVDLEGLRTPEISIEIPETTLRSLGLSYADVAQRISQFSADTPAGSVRTSNRQLLLRSEGRKERASDFANVPIVTTERGILRLGDIAKLRDGFRDTDNYFRINGEPGFAVQVQQVGRQKPLRVAGAVEDLFRELDKEYPDTVEFIQLLDITRDYRDRLQLLSENGVLGFFLILVLLALFLEPRVAFWVSAGVPVAIVASLSAFILFDVTINQLSLFAFILVLGVVVDDAIIVGEAVFGRIEEGLPPMQAAAEGAQRMLAPVLLAVTTNIIAFIPLLFVPGDLGKFLISIPLVAIIVFVFSLVEALFILPAHLAHSGAGEGGRSFGPLDAISSRTSALVRSFERNVYEPMVKAAISVPLFTVIVFVAAGIVVVGFIISGRLPVRLGPSVESRTVTATYKMAVDAPFNATIGYAETLARAAERASNSIDNGAGRVATLINAGGSSSEQGSVDVVFVASEERDYPLAEFATRWRSQIPPVADVETFSLEFRIGPGAGEDLTAELSHPDLAILRQAASEAATQLGAYTGVEDIDDGFSLGKPQLAYQLTTEGQVLGVTDLAIGQSLRSRFEGAEVRRQLRGEDELRIRVRPPLADLRREAALDEIVITSPTGAPVFLSDVANPIRQRAVQEINRVDGATTVSVTANVNLDVLEPSVLEDIFARQIAPGLVASYPDLTWRFGGATEDDGAAIAVLQTLALGALFAIFAILAVTFQSLRLAVIVLATIPFSAFAAFAGHILLGYPVSFLSVFGVIGLAGLVINGSLVLVLRYVEGVQAGTPRKDALIEAASRRFRPITLTAMTTTAGLAPLLFERSLQAQFLIPMAISLSFGALFSVFVVLFLIPALAILVGPSFKNAAPDH
ncbi:MAG: efflux RND transporter permease subunit [Pseudomonadota bacterium]